MARNSPIEAVILGSVSGLAAGAVMNQFFKRSGRIRPPQPEGAFTPREPEQAGEMATATVARRVVEGLMLRGPLTEEQKLKGGSVVHYAFSAFWGALFGVIHGSLPEAAGRVRSAAIAAPLFSLAVWEAGDNVILPAFGLGGPPGRYPLRNHAYAVLAHLVYGASTVASYEILDRLVLRRGLISKSGAQGGPQEILIEEGFRGTSLGTEDTEAA